MALTFASVGPHSSRTKLVWAGSLFASVALLLLPVLFRLDGKPHNDWQQFLGRFHPLVVHLPIGLMVLVPLLEVAGKTKPALREAAGFVLSLSFFACLSAVALGYMLAYGSGEAGIGVTRHMWGGISLSIAVLLCTFLRREWASGISPRFSGKLYPGMLVGVLLLLFWTAHQGGSLTHGDNYLTVYLPSPLKYWSCLRTAQAKTTIPSDSFYAKHIDPVFDANCVACHGESKVKGGLRLDSYNSLMNGGNDGVVVLAGNPEKSILLQRVMLPPDHKQFMPAEGKPPLKPEEIGLLQAWIAQGASPTATFLAGVTVHEEEAPPPPVGDYGGVRAEIEQTAKSADITIAQVSRNPADGLILNAIDASANFNDVQLAQFAKFAPYIVELELGHTSVTDASFDILQKFINLRALHLEDTAVTGRDLQQITRLSQLTYLNLSGTKVTSSAISPLSSMKQLRHLYLYNTPAQPLPSAPPDKPTARKAS